MNKIKAPEECKSLGEIREVIDELDAQIISLIGTRFRYVKEVVKFKANKKDIIAQSRYDEVISSRGRMAAEHNLSPDIIEKIYKLMLGYFIEEEYKILEKKQEGIR
jgi:isochorismate pyruvate lyase